MPTKKTPNVTFTALLTKAVFYVTFSVRKKYKVTALISILSCVRASLFLAFYLLIRCSVKMFFLAQKFSRWEAGSCRDAEDTTSRSRSKVNFQATQLCHVHGTRDALGCFASLLLVPKETPRPKRTNRASAAMKDMF